MKAYHPEKIFNTFLKKKTKYWYANKLISEKQYLDVLGKYKTDFYTPNIFVKIGLFIFGFFIIMAALGMYALMFSTIYSDSSHVFPIVTCLLFTAACFFVLELIIKQKNVYNAGIDEALLYFGLVFLSVAIFYSTESNMEDSPLLFALICLPCISFAVYRYSDRILTLALLFCVYAIVFLLTLKLGDLAKKIMPFVFMIVSGAIYFLIKKIKKNEELFYWKSSIVVAEFVALIILYASCNYYVIRESSVTFFYMQIIPGQDIPLAFAFYTLTAIIPILYVYFGLKRKDKTLLWSGLLLVAISVITFKYYFSLGHPEVTLTMAGIILIIIAYFSIQYLKTPKHGITFEAEIDEDHFLKSNAEALIILDSLGQKTNSAPGDTVRFGGGESGGAGSGNSY